MKLIIDPAVKKLGIRVVMALVKGANISNRSGPLEAMKKDIVKEVIDFDISNNEILEGYKELYSNNSDYKPPSQHLYEIIQKSGRMPNINTVVDCYNLTSIETFLSIGAHDTAHIEGDAVYFRITNGTEKYTPLGEDGQVKVSAGEYVAMDSEKIICRMDIKQCNETKITKDTKEFIIYVQGNRNVDFVYLEEALKEVCELIKEICGGTYEIIHESK